MLKFDTRDKKPKLWNIAILSAVMIACVLFLQRDPQHVQIKAICIVFVVYLLLCLIFLVIAYFRQLQYNPYSYNAIYYLGFSLFLLSVLITHVTLLIRVVSNSGEYDSVFSIISALVSSAQTYMLMSAPLVLFFSVALFVSNISLLRHEGRRLVNYLGIILAVLLVAGEVFLFAADYYASGSMMEVMFHDLAVNLFAALYLYFECMVIGAAFSDLIMAKHEPEKNKDYILILGCSLRKDGTPTPLLAGRIERALGFYRKQIEQTGKVPILVPSGGQGSDEMHSESDAMTEYLLAKGVPAEHILKEDQSLNTYENMLFSKNLIEERNPEAKIAFSTTNYHVFRSGLMARRVKMRAIGMGAKTKWYFWPNAAVREFVGLLTQHRLKQILVLGGMIVIYVVLTLWQYEII